MRRRYENHLHHLLDSIKAEVDIVKVSPGFNYGDCYHSNNKLFLCDNIGTFNLDKKDPDDNGIVTKDYKFVYVDVVRWIEHLEALVLAEPYCEAAVIKSVHLGL